MYPLQRNSFFLLSLIFDLLFLACLLASLGDLNDFFERRAKLLDLLLPYPSTAGSARGDVSDLLSGRRVSTDGVRTVDSLMVASAVRVIDRIHSYSRHSWVELASGLGPVVSCTGLHEGLFSPAMAPENSYGSSAGGRQLLDSTTR